MKLITNPIQDICSFYSAIVKFGKIRLGEVRCDTENNLLRSN